MADQDRRFDDFVTEVDEYRDLFEIAEPALDRAEPVGESLPEYFVPTPVPYSVTFAS